MYKCYPVDYISITTGYSGGHQAIDCGWWGSTSDRPIYSVSDGKVLEVRNNYETTDKDGNSYGNYILIQNDDGSTSTYCHLKYASCLVRVGDKIKQHQQIATMGNTGRSDGPHLHYEHRINGSKVNPFDYLYCFPEMQSINYEKPDSKYVKMRPEKPSKTLDELAYEVIEGVYGNNPERKETLTKMYESGEIAYSYEEIQNRVNEILEPQKKIEIGTRVRTTGTGNASSYGDGGPAKTGLVGTVTNIKEGRPYPYLVNEDGWYKECDLEII